MVSSAVGDRRASPGGHWHAHTRLSPSSSTPTQMTSHSNVAGRILLLLALAAVVGRAQTTSWTLTGTGDFATAGNWNNGVPNSTTNTFITNGTLLHHSVVNLTAGGDVANLQVGGFIDPYNTLNIQPAAALWVSGTQIVNDGAININGGGGTSAVLFLDNNNITLSGTGKLTLTVASGGGNASILAFGSSRALVNQSTIQGAGTIGGTNGIFIHNQGTVDANASGQTLTMDNTVGGIINTGGLLEATNGGTLAVDGYLVGNSGGNITADAGTVQFTGGVTIYGGALNSVNGGTLGTAFGQAATLDGSTGAGAVTISGTYVVATNSVTNVAGIIVNGGNIQLQGGGGHDAVLELQQDTFLQGGGTVTLHKLPGLGSASIQAATAGLNLYNSAQTIQGAGTIGGTNGINISNYSLIDANFIGQTLTIENSAIDNRDRLEATGGGVLSLDTGVVVNNAGGTITADGGTVKLSGDFSVVGGTLKTINGGTLGTASGQSAMLDGSSGIGAVTVQGTFVGDTNSVTNVRGTIANEGNIQLQGGGGHDAVLRLVGNTTLSGSGTVTLNKLVGLGSASIDGATLGRTLTNFDNTIHGSGTIGGYGFTVANELFGTIQADTSGASLTLPNEEVINAGVLRGSAGGNLVVDGTAVLNTGDGFVVGDGGNVLLTNDATIYGGNLNSAAGGGVATASGQTATLDGTAFRGALTNYGTFTGETNSVTNVAGTINNYGNIQLQGGGGHNAVLRVQSGTALTGGGTVTLNKLVGIGGAVIEGPGSTPGAILNNVDNTIQGIGTIDTTFMPVVNGGTVTANVAGRELDLTGSGGIFNSGILEATAGGILGVEVDQVYGNPGGIIMADGGSVQLRNGTIISGGMLNTLHGGTLGTPSGATATLDGGSFLGAVTINGTYSIDSGGATSTDGTIINHGNIQVNGGGGSNAALHLDADTTLQGGGAVTLGVASGGGGAYLTAGAAGVTLNNFDDKIQGSGFIGGSGFALNNEAGGMIVANAPGQTLTIGLADVGNHGTMQADAGSTLQFLGNLTNDGTVGLGADATHAGLVVESGNFVQNGDGTLQEMISSAFNGQFDVTGNIDLAGMLNIGLLDGFTPYAGQMFTLMDYTGAESGAFAGILGTDAAYWSVLYNPGEVDLRFAGLPPASAPEPSAWLDVVFMFGLALVGPFLRRAMTPAPRPTAGRVINL